MRESHGTPAAPVYVLGHGPAEQARLIAQAERLRPLTRQLFADAGLAPGMRVLDLGCGLGDVSFVAAELVGPDGEIVGVDRDGPTLAEARERAATLGLGRVAFVEHDIAALADFPAGGPFDAVVGRCILAHLPDPAPVLRAAVRHLRPGGIVAFLEPDLTLSELTIARSRLPLLQRAQGWLATGHAAAGKPLARAALTFHRDFREAGLPEPRVASHTEFGVGPDAPIIPYLAGLIGSLLPLYTRLGTLTPEEADVATLAARLRAEARDVQPDAPLAMWSFVAAWARLPGEARRGRD